MKHLKLTILLGALTAMSVVPAARATITIDYSVGAINVGVAGDTVSLGSYSGMVTLTPNSVIPVSAELNSLSWAYTATAPVGGPYIGSPSADRSLTITTPSLGSQTLSQAVTVSVLSQNNPNLQILTIGSSSPLLYSWTSAGEKYDLAVLALPDFLLNTTPSPIVGTITGDFLLTATAVPEPTTLISGVLLLLPFGASTLRILRKNRTS
jgi:hypothetical protein